MYFLLWKYREFWCFSHLIKGILLWWQALLWNVFRICDANLSLLSVWSHRVWVEVFAGFSWESEVSWFSWDSASSGLGSFESRFMEIKVTEDKDWIENRCNWIGFKIMLWHWVSRILGSRIWDLRTVWCWYKWWESEVFLSLKRLLNWWVKASDLLPALSGWYVMW